MEFRSVERGPFTLDTRLFEKAQREGEAQILEGPANDGTPVLVIVITGAAKIAEFKRLAENVLPLFKSQRIARG